LGDKIGQLYQSSDIPFTFLDHVVCIHVVFFYASTVLHFVVLHCTTYGPRGSGRTSRLQKTWSRLLTLFENYYTE